MVNTKQEKRRKEVEERFSKDFNFIQLNVIEKVYGIDAVIENIVSCGEDDSYPMWNTLFEIRDNYMDNILISNAKKLDKIGLGVIRGNEYFNTIIFPYGAGYDFYDAHWVPLYTKILKIIK